MTDASSYQLKAGASSADIWQKASFKLRKRDHSKKRWLLDPQNAVAEMKILKRVG